MCGRMSPQQLCPWFWVDSQVVAQRCSYEPGGHSGQWSGLSPVAVLLVHHQDGGTPHLGSPSLANTKSAQAKCGQHQPFLAKLTRLSFFNVLNHFLCLANIGIPPSAGLPKISLFFHLPPQFSFFLPSRGGVEFCRVLKRRDPEMCTFGLSGCRVKPRRLWSSRHNSQSAHSSASGRTVKTCVVGRGGAHRRQRLQCATRTHLQFPDAGGGPNEEIHRFQLKSVEGATSLSADGDHGEEALAKVDLEWISKLVQEIRHGSVGH